MGLFDWFNKSKQLTKDEFAEFYVRYLLQRKLITGAGYDSAEFRIQVESAAAGKQTYHLDNLYRDYCRADKAERDEILRRYSELLKFEEVPESWETVRKQLMPSIRPAGQSSMMCLTELLEHGTRKYQEDLLCSPFSDDALAMIAHDRPDTLALVNRDMLQKWGVSFEEAWQACLDNLRDNSPDQSTALGGGVIQCVWEDAYDSSRILLPDLLSRSGAGNDPVIMIPTRGCLLLAPAGNAAVQSHMIDFAQQSMDEHGRFVSALMYRYQGNTLLPYTPEDPATARKLQILRARALAPEYRDQKEVLSKIREKYSLDIFIASYMLYESPNHGGIVSLAAHVDGAAGYLPYADMVSCVIPNAKGEGQHDTRLGNWAEAATVVGARLIREESFYPPLYRVEGAPLPDSLDKVIAQA